MRVVDGDTIRVRVGGREETVRYIGIDTPESVQARARRVECFAHRAAAENERLVGGRRVRLERDAEARDRYGRLLAYVVRAEDGVARQRGARARRLRRHAHDPAQRPACRAAARGRRGRPPGGPRALAARAKAGSLTGPVPARLQQTLDSFERAFEQEAEAERVRAERLRREALARTEQRHRERRHRHGSLRFVALVLVLLATAVGVTLGMFQLLFLVMG